VNDLLGPGDIIALEDIAARAWPARVTERLGGWRLYASDGHTGRANTCWTLQDPGMPAGQAIAAVEAWYARHGLPPRFKITDAACAPADLTAALAARGYGLATETLVMTGQVPPPPAAPDAAIHIADHPDERFRAVLFEALYRDAADADERWSTLKRIAAPVFFARLDVDGVPAAIGACAVDGVATGDGWAGLSVMRTSPSHRRKGLAGRIVAALLASAHAAGARRMYLQVEAANTGAVALYERLGFATAYSYRYGSRGD
jgi:RimJ/RimL family protein N-acetyltransferase